MAIKFLAGERMIGTAAERTALSGSTPTAIPQTSWKELGRTTLTSEGDTIDVSITGSVKTNLMVLSHLLQDSAGTSGNPDFSLRVGYGSIDTGSNYAFRYSGNGGSDLTTTSTDGMTGWTEYGPYFIVTHITNVAGQEKTAITKSVEAGGTGAGDVPQRTEQVGKWVNTSNQIDKIQMRNRRSGNFGVGSEVVVLGCNNDEADSGTNFWTELGSTTLTATGPSLETGTFAAKKYLMCTGHGIYVSGQSPSAPRHIFNSDTGSNYTRRSSRDGASDATAINQTSLEHGANNASGDCFSTLYVSNQSDKEKLAIIHTYLGFGGQGAGNSPQRIEVIGKWTNTSSQVTDINLRNESARLWDIGSTIKVWGSN